MSRVQLSGQAIGKDVKDTFLELTALSQQRPNSATLRTLLSLMAAMATDEPPSREFMEHLASRPDEVEEMLGKTLLAIIISASVQMAVEGQR